MHRHPTSAKPWQQHLQDTCNSAINSHDKHMAEDTKQNDRLSSYSQKKSAVLKAMTMFRQSKDI